VSFFTAEEGEATAAVVAVGTEEMFPSTGVGGGGVRIYHRHG
jgi:hypothetical protein